MDKQARIDRVSMMEDRFDKLTRVLDGLGKAVGAYEDARCDIEMLKDYMDSGEWKEDYEADEAGLLPAGLKRGVLSQDGLYDLLQDADKVLARAGEVLAGR